MNCLFPFKNVKIVASHSKDKSQVGFCNCESVLVTQLCPTLWDPKDLPGSFVHEISQARILEWVVPFPSPEDLPNSGTELASPALQAESSLSEPLQL